VTAEGAPDAVNRATTTAALDAVKGEGDTIVLAPCRLPSRLGKTGFKQKTRGQRMMLTKERFVSISR